MTRPGRDSGVHATAVTVGEIGVLIRGASGSGKSSLALALLAMDSPALAVRLVGDDRVAVEALNGRLIARGRPEIGGWIEQRGEGIVTAQACPAAVIRCVIDLLPSRDIPPRHPDRAYGTITIRDVVLRRLGLPSGGPPDEAARRVKAFVHRLARRDPHFSCENVRGAQNAPLRRRATFDRPRP